MAGYGNPVSEYHIDNAVWCLIAKLHPDYNWLKLPLARSDQDMCTGDQPKGRLGLIGGNDGHGGALE